MSTRKMGTHASDQKRIMQKQRTKEKVWLKKIWHTLPIFSVYKLIIRKPPNNDA
jgi:hypothetical protein